MLPTMSGNQSSPQQQPPASQRPHPFGCMPDHSFTATRGSKANAVYPDAFPASSRNLTRNNSSSSQPPTGPPLLDNNEHDLLQNFFENPNNVDPSYLHMNEQYDSAGAVFNGQNVPWMMDNESPDMASPSHPMQYAQQLQMRPGSNNGYTTALSPSDPMFAAARTLAEAGHPHGPMQHQHDHQQPAGPYSFGGTAQPYPSQDFGFPGNSPANSAFQQQQSYPRGLHGPAAMPPAGRIGQSYASPPGVTRPAGPLKFGSDDSFRNGNFSGPKTELPDRVFQAAVVHNMSKMAPIDTKLKASAPAVASPGSPKRKRSVYQQPLSAVIASDSGGDAETPTVEDEREAKRRKSKAKADPDEDYAAPTSSSHASKAKSRQKPPPVVAASTESPVAESPSTDRRAPSAAAAKLPRENLSEEQKRSNHIQSEQKRRNLIKSGFEDLNRMVPELRSGGFSKSNMLMEAAKFVEKLQQENDALKQQLGLS